MTYLGKDYKKVASTGKRPRKRMKTTDQRIAEIRAQLDVDSLIRVGNRLKHRPKYEDLHSEVA